MKLTPQQRLAVRSDFSTILEACPGSGKTRAITAKLIRCVDELRDTTRRVACITYTNAAVEEIADRIAVYGSTDSELYCDVSTIHTFCLSNILGPFRWRIPCYADNFSVLPPDSERYQEIALAVLTDFGLSEKAIEQLSQMGREPSGTAIVSTPLTAQVAYDFWSRLESEGFIDFANIVYRSYQLLHEHPSLVHGLACRFAWILVDEFQDTSALQVEMLKLIADRGRTRFFLVGDPYQSIYMFSGGRPELMEQFANHVGANSDYHLFENFRCSKPIIRHAERLLPRTPPMFSPDGHNTHQDEPVLLPVDDYFEAMTDYFIPTLDEMRVDYGKAAVLAPTWFDLYPLGRRLREYGIPVSGPGARPYSRNHQFGVLAEQVCSYIQAPEPRKIRNVERELFFLLANLTGQKNFRVFTYEGRVTVCRLLKAGQQLRKGIDNGVAWLEEAATEFGAILQQDDLLPARLAHMLVESVTEMRAEMVNKRIDLANLTVDDLGLYADPTKNMKLLTIHRAKGREFEAVAMIGLHEGQLPSKYDKSAIELAEAKRKFYVAVTRAIRLVMYITLNGKDRSRFLTTVFSESSQS